MEGELAVSGYFKEAEGFTSDASDLGDQYWLNTGVEGQAGERGEREDGSQCPCLTLAARTQLFIYSAHFVVDDTISVLHNSQAPPPIS